MSTSRPPLARFLDVLYPPSSVKSQQTDQGWVVEEGARLPNPDFLHPEDIQALQKAIRDALLSPDPLPNEIRRFLGLGIDFVCQGAEFPVFKPVALRGKAGRPPRPDLRYIREPAIRYLRWCDEQRIDDSRPYATVSKAYGVHERTVRSWESAWSGLPVTEMFQDYGAEQVRSFMLAAGGRYRTLAK